MIIIIIIIIIARNIRRCRLDHGANRYHGEVFYLDVFPQARKTILLLFVVTQERQQLLLFAVLLVVSCCLLVGCSLFFCCLLLVCWRFNRDCRVSREEPNSVKSFSNFKFASSHVGARWKPKREIHTHKIIPRAIIIIRRGKGVVQTYTICTKASEYLLRTTISSLLYHHEIIATSRLGNGRGGCCGDD